MTQDEIVQLRYALHRFAGQVVTPDLARAIEAAACFEQDRSIDISPFEPEQRGEYRIGVERFADVLDELHPLHEKHWLETEKHRHGLRLDPDYDAMRRAELSGRMLQFTVRHGDELVGNLRMYVAQSLHTKTLVADEDTLYLLPEHRGGFLAMHLLRYAERVLRAVGVRTIRANSKTLNRADVLMRRMRYQDVAIQFVKVFDED